jgi:hypothetical protein
MNAGRDAVDVGGALTNAQACGRRSRVVLTPRRWRQVGGAICRRRWQKSPVTGEITKETVKTIARGMPGVSAVTVVTNARVYYTPRAAAGAPSARHSLRPLSLGRSCTHTSGALRREIAKLRRQGLRLFEIVPTHHTRACAGATLRESTSPSRTPQKPRRNPDASATAQDGFQRYRRPPREPAARRDDAGHHYRGTGCRNLRPRSARS